MVVEIRVSAVVVRRHPSAATLTPSLNTSTIGGLHAHKHKTVACCWGLLNSCPMIAIERLAMRNEGMATRTASDRRCVPMRGRRARSSRPSCRPRGFQPCRPGPARTRLQRAALRFSTGKWVNPPKKNTHRPPPRPAQHTASTAHRTVNGRCHQSFGHRHAKVDARLIHNLKGETRVLSTPRLSPTAPIICYTDPPPTVCVLHKSAKPKLVTDCGHVETVRVGVEIRGQGHRHPSINHGAGWRLRQSQQICGCWQLQKHAYPREHQPFPNIVTKLKE